MESDRFYLGHIIEAADDIADFVAGKDIDYFLGNRLLQSGVIKQIEILGEASRKLTPQFKKKYPNINWRAMTDMRNRLSHDYFGVDLFIVWKTATIRVPKLKIQVTSILENLDEDK